MKQQEKRKDKDLLLEKLRKDESFYKDILSTQVDWIWEVNDKGIYTYCSEYVKDFLGYSPQELLGKTPFDFMPPEEAKRVSAIYAEMVEKKKPIVNLENWNLHKNGKLVCLLTNGIPFYENNRNWLGYRGIGKDITNRKEMEKNLRESEEIFRAIFETAKDCIFIKNRSLRYIQVNPTMEELFGMPAENLINKTDIDLFGEVAGKHVTEIDRRVINGEIIEAEPTKPIHGIPHTFHTIKVPLKDANGNIFGLCGIARDITERKKVEEALKESEEKYRLISENANDLIVVVNQKFEIEYMNDPSYRKLIGFPKEEAIGKSVTKFIHPDDLKKAVEAFRKGLTIGEGMEEIRFKQKNGNFNLLEIQGRAFIDSKGEKKALFIARDITEKKKTLEALRESEEKFRTIAEQSLMGIIIAQDNKIKYINKTYANIFGYTVEEMKKWGLEDVVKRIHPDDVEFIMKQFEKKQKGDQDVELQYQYRGIKKKGEIIWVENYSQPIIFQGKFADLVTVIDITSKKEAEQKLIESEEKYRNYINNAPDGILIVDRLGNYIEVNKAACGITGFSEDELLKKSIQDIVAPESMEESRKFFSKIIATGKSSGDVLIKKKDGSKCYVFVDGVKLTENKFIGFHKDITERKRAEQQLKVSEKKYYQAYNLVNFYKDLFAHDMNNILQNILSSAALCELYLYEPEKLKDMSNLLKILKDQVKRGANLISNVQKLSQLEETQIITQSTEVYTVLQKAIKFIQDSIQERKLEIKVDIPWKKIHIYANELLIDVFENILLNAAKYNENPIIEIYIKLSKIQKEGIKYLKIEFKDNGIGIQDSKKEIIFQRGYKKDISIKGMGFGLSLVKKILEGYNGEIWVEDRIQGDYTKGSNFVILIPEAV